MGGCGLRVSCLGYVLVVDIGRGSSVGIATRYGLDAPGIESRLGGARFSAPVQTGPGPHPAPQYIGYWVLTGGKAAGSW